MYKLISVSKSNQSDHRNELNNLIFLKVYVKGIFQKAFHLIVPSIIAPFSSICPCLLVALRLGFSSPLPNSFFVQAVEVSAMMTKTVTRIAERDLSLVLV